MSAAYKCDRCGRLMEGHSILVKIIRPATTEPAVFDLCPSCHEKVLMCIRNTAPSFGALGCDLR